MRSLLTLAALVLIVGCGKGASSTATTDDGCPKDISADAVGKSCSSEGKSCGVGSSPRALMCQKGKWTELMIAPPPQMPNSATP